jgi:DNA-binding IclR family transcriptional regulator
VKKTSVRSKTHIAGDLNKTRGLHGGVAAVERALSILDAFRESDGQLALSQLASRTKLYKSTILRLIISLETFGYIRRLDNGDYQLGPKPSELALTYQSSFRLENFALPVLRGIVEVTRESASFYIRDRDSRVCLYRVDSPQSVRDNVRVGDVLPLGKGAAGHILKRFENGIADARTAKASQFVSATFGERQADTAAVAAPVFGGDGRLAGALSVSGPRVRFSADASRMAAAVVLSAATSLSTTLGAPPEIFPQSAD